MASSAELEVHVREFVAFWAALPERGSASLPPGTATQRWAVSGLARGVLASMNGRAAPGITPALVIEFVDALEKMLAIDLGDRAA